MSPSPRRITGSVCQKSQDNTLLIHLGGSFIEAPCKPHNRSLRSPRAAGFTPPPSFEREPHSSSPTSLQFVVFALVREPHSSSPRSHFSFMTQHGKWITNEDKNPNFSLDYADSHRIFALTKLFAVMCSKLRGAVSP
ncbi:hypothetical protein AVEN_163994-1 [Araneus ventricosus]|uniref:Uncharacterized protein n=1 Tax=Araneus ventricosus TaxID=182803 RepID=A0A4Y2DAM2_ARAVE|nr:hypothetical protein AVEN_163994-1 [Araneus ventricosus]